jgi:hypothetical protein
MVLAEHHERAGEPARAVRWYRLAANEALEGGDFAAAEARAAHAVRCGAQGEELVAARLVELDALKWSGQTPRALATAQWIMDSVPVGSVAWCRAVGDRAQDGKSLAELEDALLALDADAADPQSYVIGTARVVTQSCIRLRHERVAPLLARMELMAARGASRDPSVRGWLDQARAFDAGARHRLDVCIQRFRDARADFEEAGDVRNAMAQSLDLIFALTEAGQYALAVGELDVLLPRAHQMGLGRFYRSGRMLSIIVYARAGRTADSLKVIDDLISKTDVTAHIFGFAMWSAAVACRLAGDLARAEQFARNATDAAANWAATWREGSFVVLAGILVAQQRFDEALALTEGRAAARYDVLSEAETGMILFHVVRADALLGLGRRSEARAEVVAGVAALREWQGVVLDPAIRASLEQAGTMPRLLELARELGVS